MKRLFRPRNLLIMAVIGGVVFFVVQKKKAGELAAGGDDQVRQMVHDRVGGEDAGPTGGDAGGSQDQLAGSGVSSTS